MKPLLLLPLLLLLLSSCGRQSYNDPCRNRLADVPTNAVGKWESLMVKHIPRFGSPALDTVWPAHSELWEAGQTGKGFEMCQDGTVKVYCFTNATLPPGPGASTFRLSATGQYTLANAVLLVRLNDEVASTPFPPAPRTDPAYTRLPKRVQSEIRGAIYLALTNEAGAAGSIGLLKVSKFKIE